MKEFFVKIPEESAGFVTSLLQKSGAIIEEKDTTQSVKKEQVVSPTFLFGKWKNIDLDAKELRKKAWDRSHKF
ncbi:MAG: hypothetical protein H7Z13_21685 [Ferruginibacter sp.]|nr:hypothetical protein [Ferruginibacter sp.]